MTAVHNIIDHICDLMIRDVEDRENLHTVIKQCKTIGFVKNQELRQMAISGLPIVAVYSSVIRISKSEGLQKINNQEMSYSDLCCVLGIIAQDLMVRSQKKL